MSSNLRHFPNKNKKVEFFCPSQLQIYWSLHKNVLSTADRWHYSLCDTHSWTAYCCRQNIDPDFGEQKQQVMVEVSQSQS
jgi:hypothetical protein